MSNPTALVQKLLKYCNILRDDGLSKGDGVESPIPNGADWPALLAQVSRRLSVLEELESAVTTNHLPQSILQKVFTGELHV